MDRRIANETQRIWTQQSRQHVSADGKVLLPVASFVADYTSLGVPTKTGPMHLSFRFEFKDPNTFVEHWASKYDIPGDGKYLQCIGRPLTQDSLKTLFEWKNGSTISNAKTASIATNYPLEFSGNQRARYLNHRQPGGAIWNIFYLHCLDHREWPIFDQHTYRAMRHLQSAEFVELGTTNRQKYIAYESEYIPFLSQFSASDPRSLDRALFTYGQFLKLAARYT